MIQSNVMTTNQPTATGGWLKLHRQLMKKPIWQQTTSEQKVILMALLMKANYKPQVWIHRGTRYDLKPGQLVTSINALIEIGGRGVTHRKVRTALELFENYGFLTQQTSNLNTLITIENWETYQGEEVFLSAQVSQNRHSSDTGTTHAPTPNKKRRSKESNECQEAEATERPGAAAPPAAAPEIDQPITPCPHHELLALYHEICPDYPVIQKLTNRRKKALQARWKEYHGCQETFSRLFTRAQASAFLRGTNDRGWQADFDWIIQPDHMARILEGRYDTLRTSGGSKGAEPPKPNRFKTGFHLSESRFSHYTNEQLEAILQNKKKKRGETHANL
jgi:hypothetical protein